MIVLDRKVKLNKTVLESERKRFKNLIEENLNKDWNYDDIVEYAIMIQIIDAKLEIYEEYHTPSPGFNPFGEFDWD